MYREIDRHAPKLWAHSVTLSQMVFKLRNNRGCGDIAYDYKNVWI